MIKKIIIVAALLSAGITLSAQATGQNEAKNDTPKVVTEKTKWTSEGKDNWFLSAGAGIQAFHGEHM
ncbi:MAG: hypothetical protein HUJ94_06350, partial [Bacteroidales bacterium]|nr:hypothetical protein [Bacteroidales bacterium]